MKLNKKQKQHLIDLVNGAKLTDKQKEKALAGIERIDAEKSASKSCTSITSLCRWSDQPEGHNFWRRVHDATVKLTYLNTGVRFKGSGITANPRFVMIGCQEIKWERLEKLLALKDTEDNKVMELTYAITAEFVDSENFQVKYYDIPYKVRWDKLKKILSYKEKAQELPTIK